ncbi:MAG: radical SAM protein [Elusimicrobia bacterium]|nr:radical SAM protein [Elusimicrobiota bacterium]
MDNKSKDNLRAYIRDCGEGRTVVSSRPLGLVILLTTRCNISCIMCGWCREAPVDLPYDAVRKIFPLCPALEMINWQGGEPFLVPYFKGLFLKIKEEYPNIKQSVSTNGLLIDDDWMNILTDAHLDITFSIDAADKAVYEYIRKGASFEKLLKNLERFHASEKRKNNPLLEKTLFAVIMKSNFRQMLPLVDFAREHGFGKIQFVQKYGELPEEELFDPPDEEALEFIRETVPRVEEETEKHGIVFSHPFRYLLGRGKTARGETAAGTPGCSAPWYKLSVMPNGEIKPDCVCSTSAGNLIHDDPLEVWNNPVMQLYRENIVAGKTSGFCSRECLEGRYLGLFLGNGDRSGEL